MTTFRRHTLTAALALGLVALTGCTSTDPDTTAPTSPSTSQTVSTPTSSPTGPAVVGPPTSAAAAIQAANDSLLGYYAASYESGHAGGTRLDVVTPWATGAALQNERTLATYLQEKHYRLDGAPTAWTLNPSRSSTARSRGTNGASDQPNGSVELVGCIESTNRPVGDGAPAWTTKGQHTSIDWTVLYSQSTRRWLVASSTSPSRVLKAGSCG